MLLAAGGGVNPVWHEPFKVGIGSSEKTLEIKVLLPYLHSNSYTYSIWHGFAVQPAREPEAHRGHGQEFFQTCIDKSEIVHSGGRVTRDV
jgi:hypothetical protein